MKCDYVGCKNEARYRATSRLVNPSTGKPLNIIVACEKCAPDWLKKQDLEHTVNVGGTTFTVDQLWTIDILGGK